MSPARLTTANLTLTPLDEAHEVLYRALYSSPRVMARIAEPLDDGAAASGFRRALLANRAAPARHRTWAVIEAGTARELGIAAMVDRGDDVEIGLMLLPKGWNGRYSHEAIAALVDHAFVDLHLDRLAGVCQAGPNERMAQRLLAPHGFQRTTPRIPGTAEWTLRRSNRAVGSVPQRA